MTPAGQLPLPLPVDPALGRDAYVVAPSNAMALALIDGWRDWPGRKCLLYGPPGSGKTHLAHVWAEASGARILPAAALGPERVAALVDRPVCVEDVQAIAGQDPAERALFHLHNLALAEGQALLLTADRAPGRLGLCLPDLQSRVEGGQIAQLAPPDDALLSALLVKLFADRQLSPAPGVIAYLVARMPRSHRAAQRIVAALDAAALARQGAVTRPLATAVLAGLGEAPED